MNVTVGHLIVIAFSTMLVWQAYLLRSGRRPTYGWFSKKEGYESEATLLLIVAGFFLVLSLVSGIIELLT